jgi:hypothetical protein
MTFGSRMGIGILGGLGVGAALVYALAPSAGRTGPDHSRSTTLPGLGSGSRADELPAERLVARVRAAIERTASRPSVIAVRVDDRRVTLVGRVPAGEARELLRAARLAAAPRGVRDQLVRGAEFAG